MTLLRVKSGEGPSGRDLIALWQLGSLNRAAQLYGPFWIGAGWSGRITITVVRLGIRPSEYKRIVGGAE